MIASHGSRSPSRRRRKLGLRRGHRRNPAREPNSIQPVRHSETGAGREDGAPTQRGTQMPLMLRILNPKKGRLIVKVGHEADDGREGTLHVTIGDDTATFTRKIALYYDLPPVEFSPVPSDGMVYPVTARLTTAVDPPRTLQRSLRFPE